MLWASVPEAPVNEDRNLLLWEDDIGGATRSSRGNGGVHSIAETEAVQCLSECHLRTRVPTTIGAHALASSV